MEEARSIAFARGMDFICLGDVFYLKDSVDGIILIRTWELLKKFKNMNTFFLYGNHDLIIEEDAQYNLLATFTDCINVVIPYQKVIEDEFCFHYMSYYSKPIEFIEKFIKLESGKKNILMFHQGINSYWFNNQMRESSILTKKWLQDFGFDYVIAGHLHKRQIDEFVAYVGSTHQMSWKDKGVEMGYSIMDLDKFGTIDFITHHKFQTSTPKYVEVYLNDVSGILGTEGAFIKVIMNDKQQKEMSASRIAELHKKLIVNNFAVSFSSPKSEETRSNVEDETMDVTDIKIQASPTAILENYLDKVKKTETKEDILKYINSL